MNFFHCLNVTDITKAHSVKLAFSKESLPPVHEAVWLSHQITKLTNLLCEGENIVVHSIYRRSKAIKCGKFTLSGQNSRHSQSNVVFALKPGTTKISLAEIYYFAECTFQLNASSTECRNVWIVALKWYMEHPCHVWYGHPAQVWSCTQCTEVDYILFEYIKERCVFIKTLVNFGRYL